VLEELSCFSVKCEIFNTLVKRKSEWAEFKYDKLKNMYSVRRIRNNLALILIINTFTNTYAQHKYLFLYENEKGFSYMDSSGKPIINHYYMYAGRFSEGLAVASQNGYVGYINESGKFIIKPQFEYALSFTSGVAKIWKDGKQYIINKKGEVLFDHNYRYINYAIEGSKQPIFKVITNSRKTGLIDKNGKMLIDTIYSDMTTFKYGLATIHQSNNNVSILNIKGKVLIPFDDYYTLAYNNGHAIVQSERIGRNKFGILDSSGNVAVHKIKYAEDSGFHSSDLTDNQYIVLATDSTDNKKYPVIINSNGSVLYANKETRDIQPYSYNFATISTLKGTIIVDKNGKVIKNNAKYSYALRQKDKILFADSRGNIFNLNNKITIDSFYIQDRIFVHKTIRYYRRNEFDSWHNDENGSDLLYIDTRNKFISGLMLIANPNRCFGYLNQEGDIRYLSPEIKDTTYININYSTTFNFNNVEDLHRHQKEIPENFRNFKSIATYLDPEITTCQYRDKHLYVHNFYIINPTKDTLKFTPDSDISLIQAKDKSGKWRYIESAVGSDVMYINTDNLDPLKCWNTKVVAYQGGFKTKMRVVTFIPSHNGCLKVYSNEVDCSVNASQFVRKYFTSSKNDYVPFEDYDFDRDYTIP
jgi:hypothetical protein